MNYIVSTIDHDVVGCSVMLNHKDIDSLCRFIKDVVERNAKSNVPARMLIWERIMIDEHHEK